MTKPTNYSTFPMPARRRAGEAADVNADFMTNGSRTGGARLPYNIMFAMKKNKCISTPMLELNLK